MFVRVMRYEVKEISSSFSSAFLAISLGFTVFMDGVFLLPSPV